MGETRAAAERKSAHGSEQGNLRRKAIVRGQAASGAERGLILLEGLRAVDRRQEINPAVGRAKGGRIRGIFERIQMRFGKGVEAQQKRNLSDVGQSGQVA